MVVIPDDLDGLSEDITALSAEFENAELPAMLAGIGDGTASAFDSAGVDYERDAAAAGDPNPGEAPEDLPGTSPLDATTPADAAADGPFTAAEGDWRVSDAASADALVDDVIQESEPETAPAPVSSATPFGSRSIELGSALLNLAFSAEGFLAAEDGWQAPAVEHGAGDAVQDRDGVSEVFDTFATEAAEHIDVLGRAAMQLERDPAAPEPLREIVRTLHTLKGAAAAAGSEPIAERCHALEDALAELERTSSRPGRAFVDSLYAMVDEVEALIASTRQGDGQMVDLTDQRGAAAAGGDLRVNIQRVDSLLNLVGELVVNRAAFEQRLLRFGATIDELALSAERLRRSSQNLDRGIAGSSSLTFHAPATLFPSNGLAAHGGEFDALEMDRYSEYDRIVRELLEIASDVGAAAGELGQLRGDLETVSTRQQRLTSALQDELMDVRMVPFGTIAPRLHRVVRGVADERGKDVELVFEGSATPFDKAMLEALSDSLLHLLRNAVDHGVERPDQRAAAGKPRRGTIRVRSYRDGNQVVIEVLDDGRGIDHQQVIERARALEHPVHDEMTRGEALQLIFLPGFTTRDSIDAVSGRGVGLEIVKAAVARLKGRITVDSQPGAGTAFRLRMPIMLAVAQAFMVTAGGRRFAVPAGSVELVADRAGARISRVGDTMVLDVGDAVMPLIDLGERLDGRGGETLEQPNGWLLITRIGDERWAIRVDGLEGQQEIVVKPLGRFLKNVPSVVGATILGNGDIALILDIQQLTGVSARVRADIVEALGGDEAVEPPVATSATRVALIVDDSLSVRRVLGRTLARHGWETLLARDGVEALDTLERNVVDVIVTDIEMPRMDGFELMSAIRRHAKAATTPVVVLTSRSGDKHRAKAFEMGANAYLIKPFQEQELLDTLAREARLPMRAAR
jgi:chemosensory pili system protein ChpA (sensor histidine kinase/response regulator)